MKKLLFFCLFFIAVLIILFHSIFKTEKINVPFKPVLFKFVKDTDKSPLMKAAEKGDVQTMQVLIDQGADVNENEGMDQPHHGHYVLGYAINSGSAQAVKLLLESGAKVDTITDIDEFAFNRLEPNARVSHLGYAIMINAPIEVIDLLINQSKNLNFDHLSIGWTPYLIAKRYGNEKAAQALSNAGADTSWYRYKLFKQYMKHLARQVGLK